MDKGKNSKKYEVLREKLLNYIKDNNLRPTDKLPTIREIIKDFNFSYTTVNRTLIELENEGWISKQQGKGLFVKRIETKSDTKQVALIIPNQASRYKIFMDILTGVRNALEKANIGLLVSISNMSHQKEKEIIEMLISKHIDGIIIYMEDNYRQDYSHIKELKERNYPFVLIDRYIPELETDYVVINNKDAMFRVCSYLKYNKNCDKIILVPDSGSTNDISSTREKLHGYMEAMRVLYNDNAETVLTVDDLIANIDTICKTYRTIGICLNHDTMIPEMEARIREVGKELPGNCHLFGYNNSYEVPVYPTVEQFNDLVGLKAAEILIEKMKNPNSEIVQIKIEPKLILPDGNGNFFMES